MKMLAILLLLSLAANSPAITSPTTIPGSIIAPQFFSGFGDLPLRQNPPVIPRYARTGPYEDSLPRKYFAFDLNGDGKPEYLVEDWDGAHAIGFVPVDAYGKPLLRAKDIDNFGGDRILILTQTHHGYHDLVCSKCYSNQVNSQRWEYNGKYYMNTSSLTFYTDKHFIENSPSKVAAAWYGDPFSFSEPAKKRLHWHYP